MLVPALSLEESLARQGGKPESRRTESIAIGSKEFGEKTKANSVSRQLAEKSREPMESMFQPIMKGEQP